MSHPPRPSLAARSYTTGSHSPSPPTSADSLTRATSLSLSSRTKDDNLSSHSPATPVSVAPLAEVKRHYSATGNERVFPMRNVVHARPPTMRMKTSVGAPYPASLAPGSPQSPQNTRSSFMALSSPGRGSSQADTGSHTYSGPSSDTVTTTPSVESDAAATAPSGRRASKAGFEGFQFPQTPLSKEGVGGRCHEMRKAEEVLCADGGSYWILGGEPALEEEALHRSGRIQSFGVVIVLEEDDIGNFVVQQVSENSTQILQLSPMQLFAAPSLTGFFTSDSVDIFLDAVDALDDADTPPASEEEDADPIEDQPEKPSPTLPHPEHFRIEVIVPSTTPPPSANSKPAAGTGKRFSKSFHCSLHRPEANKHDKRLVLELEHVEDTMNPLKREWAPASPEELDSDRRIFDERPDGMNDPSAEEIYKSTMSLMKPLRALSKRRSRREPEINMVQLVFQIEEQLRKAKSLEVFLSVTAGIFKELTGFDRSMVIQFDEDWNGRVVAEQVDRTRSKDCYLDLTFPAADIASASLAKSKLSLLYNRDAAQVNMCGRTKEQIERPVDMTRCQFRTPPVERLRYLAQRGVRSTMNVSLFAFSKLWGIVTLFSHGPAGHRVSVPIRNLCSYLGESLSRTIERLSYERRLQARRIINTSASTEGPATIVSRGEDLLELFNSDFGCLSVGEEAKILGEVSNAQEILAILEYLRAQCFTTVQMSQEISADFPDCRAPDPTGFKGIAGMLVVPLSPLGLDFIVFFRRGTPQEVRWAGSRPGHPSQEGIEIWRQVSAGKSKPWDDEVAETAEVLGVIYSRFINVWREKESAVQANSVTSLLLANASHEVRTPLNAIVNFLELAIDASNDGIVNENLQKTHDASKSLVHVINDLLDLTRHESGGDLFVQEPFDIRATIEDAISIQRTEAKRKGLTLEVVEDPQGTPPILVGDRAKVRQIIATSVGNAVKYTQNGTVVITYGELVDDPQTDGAPTSALARKDSIRIGLTITDTGKGIEDDKLEALFSALHHVKHDSGQQPSIGLGLAVSARIVENLGGQMRVDSKVGEGSKFQYIIPFGLPDSTGSGSTPDSDRPPLVRRNSSGSGGSKDSIGSRDSKRSEIESLISAISATHLERRRLSKSKGTSGGGLSRPRSFVNNPDLSRAVTPRSSHSNLAALAAPIYSHHSPLPTSSLAPPLHMPTTASPLSEPARLPSIPRKMETAAPVPVIATPPPKRQQLKILVVDDERINRTLIERRLMKDSHDVHLCEHGGLAVQAMEEDPTFDLILMDLNMPICDGYEAASIIRQCEANYIFPPGISKPQSHILNRGVPIIAVSANIHERDRPRLIAAGIDGWVVKPVRFDRLRQIMEGAVDPSQRQKDLYRPGELEAGGWYSTRRGRST